MIRSPRFFNNPKYLNGGDKLEAMSEFHKFCIGAVRFLVGKIDNNRPIITPNPFRRYAICLLLQVSRRYIYGVTYKTRCRLEDSRLRKSIFDEAGDRRRQTRRDGKRSGNPYLDDLLKFGCGCSHL